MEVNYNFFNYFIIFHNLAGIHENTRNEIIHNNTISTIRINQNVNHFSYSEIHQNNLLDEDEEESAHVDGNNQESEIFGEDEYYEYNEIFNSYFSRQLGRQLTLEDLKEKISSIFTFEK